MRHSGAQNAGAAEQHPAAPPHHHLLWIARAYLAEQNRREAENILQQIVKLAPDLYPGREAARLLAELPAKAEG